MIPMASRRSTRRYFWLVIADWLPIVFVGSFRRRIIPAEKTLSASREFIAARDRHPVSSYEPALRNLVINDPSFLLLYDCSSLFERKVFRSGVGRVTTDGETAGKTAWGSLPTTTHSAFAQRECDVEVQPGWAVLVVPRSIRHFCSVAGAAQSARVHRCAE